MQQGKSGDNGNPAAWELQQVGGQDVLYIHITINFPPTSILLDQNPASCIAEAQFERERQKTRNHSPRRRGLCADDKKNLRPIFCSETIFGTPNCFAQTAEGCAHLQNRLA